MIKTTCDSCGKNIKELDSATIFCKGCSDKNTRLSKEAQLLSELLFGEKFAPFHKVFETVLDLKYNKMMTDESIASCSGEVDPNFIEWFKTNCQGYTDIERDIAYAAWKESRKFN